MIKKKNTSASNYLDHKPVHNLDMTWSSDENGIITLEIQNKGVFNLLAQKLLKKPPVTYIHLDKIGSFVWDLIDGNKTIFDLGICVEAEFGDDAKPLYERLSKFFQILYSYGFIKFNEK